MEDYVFLPATVRYLLVIFCVLMWVAGEFI